MIRREIRHKSRNRRVVQETCPCRPGDATPTFVLGSPTTHFTLTTDFGMVLQQFPPGSAPIAGIVDADGTPLTITAITQVSPTEWDVTSSAALADPVTVTIPDQWPYLRTTKGGYITPGTYEFAGVP